jgi:hypothetical protein
MALENEKCEKYGMHHDFENGVEIRKCQFCERDNQPERSKREDHHLTLDDFSDNPSKEQLAEEMKILERKVLDTMLSTAIRRDKIMDEIEKIIPPKLPRGMAISLGKIMARFKRTCGGINEELLGPKQPERSKQEDFYQKLAKEYLDEKEHWETDPSERISISCFASWLDRRCGAQKNPPVPPDSGLNCSP